MTIKDLARAVIPTITTQIQGLGQRFHMARTSLSHGKSVPNKCNHMHVIMVTGSRDVVIEP